MFVDLPYEISQQIILQTCSITFVNIFYKEKIKIVYNKKIHTHKFLFKSPEVLKTLLIQEIINGEEALIQAARDNNLELVKLLVEHGCDPKARDNEALIKANRDYNFEIIDYLKSYTNRQS